MLFSEPKIPQSLPSSRAECPLRGFSALQRAENSSIQTDRMPLTIIQHAVSVLFSEPKIPQSNIVVDANNQDAPFQCSSASRKFLNSTLARELHSYAQVSVLFSEPKIPQSVAPAPAIAAAAVSVLFSEPKIPQSSSAPPIPSRRSVSVLFSEPKIPQCSGSRAKC